MAIRTDANAIVIISTILKRIQAKYNCKKYDTEAVITIISYDPMWETMKEKSISQYKLLNEGIDNKTLDSLKKGGNITMRTLENICRILDCNPSQVVRFVSSDEERANPKGKG